MKNFTLLLCLITLCVAGCKKDEIPQVKPAEAEKELAKRTDAQKELYPLNTKGIARVTGKSLAGDGYLNPNQTDVNYNVGGTDLGIMWDLGGGYTGVLFGDTFGSDWISTPNGGGNGSNWRSNVVGFSNDRNLDDGLTLNSMITDGNGSAKEIITSPHNTSGNGSFTSIPTAAIRVNKVDYVHYMDIKQWGTAGSWVTNSSGIYMSANNGQSWSAAPGVTFASKSKFAQAAYTKSGQYIYMIGTRSGRFSSAYLARFTQQNILQQAEYEYWNGTGWTKNDEAAAVKILDGPVGEISIVYNTRFGRWIVAYLDESRHAIVMRSCPQITGPWSGRVTLVSADAVPGLYGAYIHPTMNDSDDLYFLMSVWQPYNVFLVKSKLVLR